MTQRTQAGAMGPGAPFGGMVIAPVPQLDADGLRTWRTAHGLTIYEAAEYFGVSARTLYGLEQGRSVTSPLWGPMARIIELTKRGA